MNIIFKTIFYHYQSSELASGWDFFEIPNPDPRDSGSEFENPEKISGEKSRKLRNPGDRDRYMKTSKKSRVKNPEKPKNRRSGSGYENLAKISSEKS